MNNQPIAGYNNMQPQGTTLTVGAQSASTAVPTAPLPQLPTQKKHTTNLMMLTVATVLGLVAVTFIGLFIWMWLQWSDLRSTVDSQIESATAIAVSENTALLEDQFAEREKYPYSRFSAPEDYGSLEFEYPRTWSVYISSDATNGREFSAVLNPESVVANSKIYALHVEISTNSYDTVINTYSNQITQGKVTHSTRSINNTTANLYTGESEITLIIKIRDKVAKIWTDALAYSDDFYKIIDTITYNA